MMKNFSESTTLEIIKKNKQKMISLIQLKQKDNGKS